MPLSALSLFPLFSHVSHRRPICHFPDMPISIGKEDPQTPDRPLLTSKKASLQKTKRKRRKKKLMLGRRKFFPQMQILSEIAEMCLEPFPAFSDDDKEAMSFYAPWRVCNKRALLLLLRAAVISTDNLFSFLLLLRSFGAKSSVCVPCSGFTT